MKSYLAEKCKVIHGKDAKDFEEQLNWALAKTVGSLKHELHFNDGQGFCAYVVWSEYVNTPETLADEYELRGERHYCAECPYLNKPTDRRIKNFHCSEGRYISCGSRCCDLFYARLEKGEITPNEV